MAEDAAAASSDRLSDLPDDLLIHILSFLDIYEAARTTVLSRRWRDKFWFWIETTVDMLRSCPAAGDLRRN
jgi:hypothetical protein